ncbi:MAG: XdhC family protein [Bacteroidales bacterium]|jgi:xanthine dehydrogenase accessory factor|nr:XdhC family protein [Bacteroidales bacterium]
MEIWSFIQKELSENNNVMLITVVERNGSSPGIVGFKMAVSETGTLMGSIGGGVMEYNMVELAKKEAKSAKKKAFIKKQIHNPDAGKDKSGLICSGEQNHAFILLDSSKKEIVNTIVELLDKGETGALGLNQDGLQFNENQKLESQIIYSFKNENNWDFKEQIGVKPTLYIFGAGHVSLPISEIFRVLDFKVVVYDNRKGLSTFENNKHAHQKQIIDYNSIENLIDDEENSFAIIMTVGHKSDELVLKQLVRKNLKYLGMIGSKNKVKNIFESLKNKGISETKLALVDSPIGLSINSKSTAEIAISIAAKIIQVKNC